MAEKIIQQPTYKRQRFLLDYIRHLPTSVNATDLQKLVFLHEAKNGFPHYEFIPYRFGSYSFQLREDLEILARDRFILMNQTEESLRIQAKNHVDGQLYDIPNERGDDLIRKAYRAYPYYTIQSQILDRIFSGEELLAFKRYQKEFIKDEQKLFTVGYEGQSIESFINILLKKDVRVLCDIRKNPLSRKFGFSKGRLSQICKTVGIRYVHIPGLGIESEKRASLTSVADHNVLFDEYENSLTGRSEFLREVYALLKDEGRVALMCYERKASMCHRHVVRDYLIRTHKVESTDL